MRSGGRLLLQNEHVPIQGESKGLQRPRVRPGGKTALRDHARNGSLPEPPQQGKRFPQQKIRLVSIQLSPKKLFQGREYKNYFARRSPFLAYFSQAIQNLIRSKSPAHPYARENQIRIHPQGQGGIRQSERVKAVGAIQIANKIAGGDKRNLPPQGQGKSARAPQK